MRSLAPRIREAAARGEETDVIVVQANRSGRDVEEEPIRVDVIGEEEVTEKQLMVPGNVSMLIKETVGVKMQVTSPWTDTVAANPPQFGGNRKRHVPGEPPLSVVRDKRQVSLERRKATC